MNEHAPLVYGKYQLLELIARGGMAEVFKAKSHGVEGFEKVLVIKRILPELSESARFVEMFINEAKIAVTLSHANIVQVFDLGRADESYFIAMEYVGGPDLASVLRRGRRHSEPLPLELAVFVASEVAKALDYAHRRRDAEMQPLRIVHRDVSPQNVLLSYEGEVKLTDFGIARVRTTVEAPEDSGELKGKYAYMSPEQARGEAVDARTDIFALGIVLYESLVGEHPFLETSSYETLKKVRVGFAPTAAEVNPEIPAELSAIVARAMAPRLEERYENAGQLYDDLVQFIYSTGTRAGPQALARYLEELKALSSRRRGGSGNDANLRAAFDVEPEPREASAVITATQIPRRRSSRPSHGGDTTGSLRRPSVQLDADARDLTMLCVCAAPDDPLTTPRMQESIRRAGGLVLEASGGEDGSERWLVAVFGVMQPDGRDADAAARCALSLLRSAKAADEQTTIQIAIHGSRMKVGLSGTLLRDEAYAAAIAESKRLARRAPFGTPLVSPSAEGAIRRHFHLRPGGDAAIELHAEKEGLEGLTAFVGRRLELRRVGAVLAFANRGHQRTLAIVGEAGVGKTRLMLETIRRLRQAGHDVAVHLARLERQAQGVPLAGVQEMLRSVLGVDDLDSEELYAEKVRRLRELGLSRAEMASIEALFGIDSEGADPLSGQQRPLRSALERVFLKLAQDRLTVFVFDGVESMDPESLTLLEQVLRSPRKARMVFLFVHRPGAAPELRDVPAFEEIVLTPFDEKGVGLLLQAGLGSKELPAALVHEVVAKSGGNPLYVEEYLQAMLEAGAIVVAESGRVHFHSKVAEVQVPKTLRGMVSARVARVGVTEHQLLHVAAVINAPFTPALLARVCDLPADTVLQTLELLERRGFVKRWDADEYVLTHDLVGEVLRDGLPLEARRDMHLAVAAALENLYPSRADELAERLAAHFRAGGNRDRATDYLVRAADRLEVEHSLRGAVASLERAIELLMKAPNPDRDRILALYQRAGDLSFRGRDLRAGERRLGAALDLADGLGREAYVARFAMMRGRILVHANQLAEGGQWLERARRLARRLGDSELLREVTAAVAEANANKGDYASAVGQLREVIELAHQAGDDAGALRSLLPLALACAGRSDREGALAALAEARELAGAEPDRFLECDMLKTESLVHYFTGEQEAGMAASERALELAKEYGFAYEAAVNAHNLGEAHLNADDYRRAFSLLRYSYELARENGFLKLQHTNMRALGYVDAVKFGSPQGRDRIVQAAEYAEESGYVWELIQAKYMLAAVDHHQGRRDAAEAGFREVLELAGEHQQRSYEHAADKALRAM
ncbi:MAG: protein kinase, partial [Myxococcales bacterium]|nr:protein kinase [Myxococcales bacterium]